MLIQIILLIGFLAVLYVFLINHASHQSRAWTKIFALLFVVLAVIVVVFPESSNTVAHWVGVQRGADLLLYLMTLAFIFVVLKLYIKSKEEHRKIVLLTRKIALIEASQKHPKNN